MKTIPGYKLGGFLVLVLALSLGFYFSRFWFFPAEPQIEEITAQALAPGVLFQDEFTDPDSGWPADERGDASFGYQPPTFYFLELETVEDKLTVFRGLNLTDFSVETTAVVNFTNTSKGNFRYGLAVRRSGEQYYAFTISPRDRSWRVFKHNSNGGELLAEDKHEAIQGTFQLYSLAVIAKGASLSFQVNEQSVTNLTDSDYSGGDVGFIIETLDEDELHVAFDGLTIREIEGQSIAAAPTATAAPPTPTASATPTATPTQNLPTPTAIPVLILPTSSPTPTALPTPSPRPGSPTSTATAEPPTLTPSPLPLTPTVSPTRPLNLTPAPTSTTLLAPPTPTPSPTASATPTPSTPAGSFVLLNPVDVNSPSYGPTTFEWEWSGAVPTDYGFEVRVWREGEPLAGAHDAVADNQSGNIQQMGQNKYQINFDVRGAAGVQGRSGEYLWTVALVRISPGYADLGQQAEPARFRFEAGGGGGDGDSGGGGGGGGVGLD